MRKIFIGLLLLIIIISVIGVSWLYPVSEISGYIKCQEIFYFDIHSNGDVDYYIGYYNIMTKGSENADLAKENIHMKKKLTLKQKYDINKCVKKIIGNDTKDKEKEVNGGGVSMCVKINDICYYSDMYIFGSKYDTSNHIFKYSNWEPQSTAEKTNPNVLDLCMTMWILKPEELSQLWNFDWNNIPPKEFNQRNYKIYLKEWRDEWEKATKGIVDEIL